jgi:hypothetical protein
MKMKKKVLISIFAYLTTLMVGFAQNTVITGKVIDDKGATVSGASIVEKSTKKALMPEAMVLFQLM